VKKKVLTQLIADGMVQTRETSTGDLLVVAENNGNNQDSQTKEEIIAANFAHLRERGITISQAVESYEVPDSTIRNWVSLGFIAVVDTGYPMKVDEADVAYCAKVYHERGGQSGTRLFDKRGNPYQLKHPGLAEYRRRKRQEIVE
jgi:hypothetical protein